MYPHVTSASIVQNKWKCARYGGRGLELEFFYWPWLYSMYVFILQGSEFLLVSESLQIVGRRYRPNYWTYIFKWVPNHRDHGESKHMKNSCFSGPGFFTGAGIEPATFQVRVRRTTAEPSWLSWGEYLVYLVKHIVIDSITSKFLLEVDLGQFSVEFFGQNDWSINFRDI